MGIVMLSRVDQVFTNANGGERLADRCRFYELWTRSYYGEDLQNRWLLCLIAVALLRSPCLVDRRRPLAF
jgi:hypothetical protein